MKTLFWLRTKAARLDSRFTYREDCPDVPKDTLEVHVPGGLADPQALLDVLSEQLSFPDYFGDNWNALNECLCDLSWIEPGRVVLCLQDIPLSCDPGQAHIYLDILAGAIDECLNRKRPELEVVFPASLRRDISRLLDESRYGY